VVRRGELKLGLRSPEGREQIVRLARPGRLLAESFAPTEDVCPVSAVARTTTELSRLPNRTVVELIGRSPELACAVMSSMRFCLEHTSDVLFNVSLRSVEERLAAFVMSEVERQRGKSKSPQVIERRLDVGTIASMLGTVREEITRAQARLRERGVLDIDRRRVTVLDPDALERLAGE
jgi:CRP/FNR family transcriptional regulator